MAALSAEALAGVAQVLEALQTEMPILLRSLRGVCRSCCRPPNGDSGGASPWSETTQGAVDDRLRHAIAAQYVALHCC